MDVDAYLARIGFRERPQPEMEALTRLHRAHLFTVPFENLDIRLGHPIVLSLPRLFEKIVVRRRGGFCYELNGLFGWLLRELGFGVDMLSARVFHDDGTLGPEFDHMLLMDQHGDRVLADVGFGDSFVTPIPFGLEGSDPYGRSYRQVEHEDGWILEQRTPEAGWKPQYLFGLKARRLDEFEAMCHYQQTSPKSTFTRKSVCSKATEQGRITLSNGRLIVTAGNQRSDRPIRSIDDYRAQLRRHFGFDLDGEPLAERLLLPAGD